jgi:2'-5' RNA ligase
MTDEQPIRAFLALDPPGEILREIAVLQDRLRKRLPGDIRWVRPEGIHLTLKFFGDVFEKDLAGIAEVVRERAAGVAPFSLSVGGIGVFPDPRRPRVLYLGMKGDAERLVAFQGELEGALKKIGFPGEERPFRPHLTLGRFRSPAGLAGLAGALEKGGEEAAGRFVASGLDLFRSELTPRGAIYTKIERFPFAGKDGG